MPHPSTRTEGRGKLNLGALPIELRPGPALLRYYALLSLFAGPLFPIPLTALWLRYRTLRYRIEEDGISMRWGALFRREVSLNYARIQDIHLSSNVVERWLGLGKIQVQTASASSKAEMTVEGVPDLQVMRDFLYGRMRGAKSGAPPAAPAGGGAAGSRIAGRGADDLELARALRDVAAEVRALREALEAESPPAGPVASEPGAGGDD